MNQGGTGRDRAWILLSILTQKSSSQSMSALAMGRDEMGVGGRKPGVHISAFGEIELGFGFYGRPGCSLSWTQTKSADPWSLRLVPSCGTRR